MSGLEIVGVVLGAIPICVIALDGYIKGSEQRRRWKECRYDLISLRRVLTTHHSILENTCRSLLAGTVSDETLELLFNASIATGWENPAIAKPLEQKLGTSLQPCLACLDDVYAEIQKIYRILKIGPDGKVDWDNKSFLKRHLKWLSMTLETEERERLIQNLRARTHDLQTLLQSTERLQTASGAANIKSSKMYDFKGIRQQAYNLYQLLLYAWRCTCATHVICLRLENREVRKSNQPIRFHVKVGLVDCWCEAELERIQEALAGSFRSSDAPMAKGSIGVVKKVQFMPDRNAPTQSTGPTTQQSNSEHPGSLLENLCDLKTLCGSVHVLRHTNGQRHRLIQRAVGADPAWITLDKLVDNSKPRASALSSKGPMFTYSGHISRYYRRKLALILVSSALQLHGTGWGSYRWSQDVVFSTLGGDIQMELPFISKPMHPWDRRPEPANPDVLPSDTFEMRRDTLFALATILIQLCFHSPWKKLQQPEDIILDEDDGERLSNRCTASRVAGMISAEEGVRYQEIVQYCIEWADLEENLELSEDAFQSAVCENVLVPLREEMANFAEPLSR